MRSEVSSRLNCTGSRAWGPSYLRPLEPYTRKRSTKRLIDEKVGAFACFRL